MFQNSLSCIMDPDNTAECVLVFCFPYIKDEGSYHQVSICSFQCATGQSSFCLVNHHQLQISDHLYKYFGKSAQFAVLQLCSYLFCETIFLNKLFFCNMAMHLRLNIFTTNIIFLSLQGAFFLVFYFLLNDEVSVSKRKWFETSRATLDQRKLA